MKYIICLYEFFTLAFLGLSLAQNPLKCHLSTSDVPMMWKGMTDVCTHYTFKQISIVEYVFSNYLAMAAYFSRDTINRLGYANYFFQSVEKSRKSLINLLNYLSLRGENALRARHSRRSVTKHAWQNVAEALTDALKMEIMVNKSLERLMDICERERSDRHILDYVQKYYYDEQIHKQKDLVDKIIKLEQMLQSDQSSALAEFVLDKEL